jgi:NAD(P)-dependent dehydrogenase (short-subunit alcohol dehydrogenase family)
MGRLTGKIAVIAGASWDGIGGMTALRFAEEGARLVLNAEALTERLVQTQERVTTFTESIVVPGDVRDDAMWQALVAETTARFGPPTTLVYTPARCVSGSVLNLTDDDIRSTFDLTFDAAWRAARRCIPAMASHGSSVVFVSSVNATLTNAGYAAYGAAKAALEALTRTLALECAALGVRVNAVAPGQIEGVASRRILERDAAEDDACRACYPIGRYGEPMEVANAILFLASDEASFITGSTLRVDGGLSLVTAESLLRPSFRHWKSTSDPSEGHE